MDVKWKIQDKDGQEVVSRNRGFNLDGGNVIDDMNLEETVNYLNTLEIISNGLYELINKFESEVSDITGVKHQEISGLSTIKLIMDNMVNGRDMYEGIPESLIAEDKRPVRSETDK